MRKIIFTSRKIPNNSFKMRGEQICNELQLLGYDVDIVDPSDIYNVRGSIIIWVRRMMINRQARKLNKYNIVLLDPLDNNRELFKHNTYKYVHALIASSKHQYNQLPNMQKYVIYHHYDPRITLQKYNKFQLGYWGYSTAADHTRNLIKGADRYSSTREFPYYFFERISCHYNVRTQSKGFGWRPTTKISTAAGSGCNIITSNDEMSKELLPNDYPYWINKSHDIEEVKNVIKTAQNDFGKDRWNYGLKCMKSVRDKTNIDVIAKQYGKIIEEVDSKWPA